MSRIIIKSQSPLIVGKQLNENEWAVDTDVLSEWERTALNFWMKEYPDAVRPDPTPVPAKDTRPDVIERPTPAVKSVDPIEQLRKEDLRQQIEQQYANERLIEYQVVQGLVDDSHNAALLRDWIQTYGQAYRLDVNVDRAIHALRPQLHWKPLSEFTKRLAGF